MGFFDRLFRRSNQKSPQPEPAEPPPEWASFFKSGQRYERFEACVRRYFVSSGVRPLIIDGVVRIAPEARSKPMSDDEKYGLANIGQLCARSDEAEWPALIERHFGRLRSERRDLAEYPEFSQVRSRLGIRLWESGALPRTDMMVVRHDIPGLDSVLCIDHPESITTACREDAQAWELTIDALFELALENQASLAPVEHSRHDFQDGHTLHEFSGESPFACSFALRLPDAAPEVGGPHGYFLAVPTRHLVVAMPFLNASSLQVLGNFMAAVTAFHNEGPGSVSARVYWQLRGETVEIPYRLEGQNLQVTPPERFVEYLDEHLGDAR